MFNTAGQTVGEEDLAGKEHGWQEGCHVTLYIYEYINTFYYMFMFIYLYIYIYIYIYIYVCVYRFLNCYIPQVKRLHKTLSEGQGWQKGRHSIIYIYTHIHYIYIHVYIIRVHMFCHAMYRRLNGQQARPRCARTRLTRRTPRYCRASASTRTDRLWRSSCEPCCTVILILIIFIICTGLRAGAPGYSELGSTRYTHTHTHTYIYIYIYI